MPESYTVCAVVGQFADPRVADCAVALITMLRERGLEVLAAQEEATGALPAEARRVPRTELARRSQFVIAIGGDGTLLHAARLVADSDVPLLGINLGRLGFLTDVGLQELDAGLAALLEGRCVADRRALLEARLMHTAGGVEQRQALNDIVLLRRETGRLLDFRTNVDGRYVNSHSGDGLIIATATGSTAYALSCGGPIVDPRLNVLVMAPVCPHTLSDRPIVIPGNSRIEVHLEARGEGRAEVACDGIALGEMQPGDRLEIGAAGSAVTLLHPPGYDYFRLLRSKLHWGRGGDKYER
ncbi:MAG TPA: NAD(+)/NADH kinase [Steroidobacteraceae bacterium]